MNKKGVSLLIEAFRGLPVMNEILNILEKKEFIDDDNCAELGDSVVGVMSPLTRAMFKFLETAGKSEFEKVEDGFMYEGPFPCFGLEFECLQKVRGELDICPYAKALMKFNEEHPLLIHFDFVRKFMRSLISSQVPGGERIVSFYVVTSQIPESYNPDYPKYDGWEKMDLEQLIEVSIQGSFLEPIVEILASGEFHDEETSIVDGEIVIREMTDLEKAIFTPIVVVHEAIKAMIAEHTQLLKGENFIETTRPKIDVDPFMGIGMMISIDLSHGEERGFIPKDKNHPDFIKVKELGKLIKSEQAKIQPIESLLWPIIKMNLNPKQTRDYNVTGIRSGFQIIVFNEKEEIEQE